MTDQVALYIIRANTDSNRLSILISHKKDMQKYATASESINILKSFYSDINRIDALSYLNTNLISPEAILSLFHSDTYRVQALIKINLQSNDKYKRINEMNDVSILILMQFDSDMYRVEALKNLSSVTCGTVQILKIFNSDVYRLDAMKYLNTDTNQIEILKQFKSDVYRVDALRIFTKITTTVVDILHTFYSDSYKIDVLDILSSQNIAKSYILSIISQFTTDSSKKTAFDKIKNLYQIQDLILDILELFESDSVKIKLCDENRCDMLSCDSNAILSFFRKTSSKRKVAKILNIIDKISVSDNSNSGDSDESSESSVFESSNHDFTNSLPWIHRSSINSKVIIDGVDIGKVVREKTKLEKENKKLKRNAEKKKEKIDKIVNDISKISVTLSIPECLDNETDNETLQCVVCLINENKIVLNCGHQYCRSCISDHLEKNKECPDCRQKVTAAIRIFNRH